MRASLFLLAACGRLGFDAQHSPGDGGSGIDATPCTFGPWQAPRHLEALSTAGDDFGGQVTGDGLGFYVQQDYRVVASHRASRAEPFPPAVEVAELNDTGNQIEVAPTNGELEVYLARDVGGQCIWYAHRASTAEPFSTPLRLEELCASQPAVGPMRSRDGLTLYYSDFAADPLGRMWESHRASTADSFGIGIRIPGFDDVPDKGYPFVVPDGLTLYWEGGGSPHHLMESHRATTTDAWGPSVPIANVDDDSDNEDVSITDDGLELYFSSRRAPGTQMDVWRSSRTCD